MKRTASQEGVCLLDMFLDLSALPTVGNDEKVPTDNAMNNSSLSPDVSTKEELKDSGHLEQITKKTKRHMFTSTLPLLVGQI